MQLTAYIQFLYTALLLIEIYLPVKFQVGISSGVESGKRRKAYSNNLFIMVNPWGGGNLARILSQI